MYRAMPRVLGVTIVAALVLPAVYYGSQYVNANTLYPGDEVVTRNCRICQGDGKCPELAAEHPNWPYGETCPACTGTGKVEVIIPGPERPTVIHGAIVHPDMAEFADYEQPVFSNSVLLSPCPGGMAGVEVVIEPEDGSHATRVMTNNHGRYLAKLAPGEYTVSVRAAGYPDLTVPVTIDKISAEIWLEKIRNIVPPETAAEQYAWYGRSLTIGLQE